MRSPLQTIFKKAILNSHCSLGLDGSLSPGPTGSGVVKAGTKGEKARGGLDFHLLARGTERSYSTGYLVNLDQHTLGLVGDNVKKSNFSLGLDTLVTHAKRIFDQVCVAVFGSVSPLMRFFS